MTPDEYKEARKGNWADSQDVENDPGEMGKKWLWESEDDAKRWLDHLRRNGEDGIIAEVLTAKPLADYPSFDHPPQGTAVHVPIEDLGPATRR